MVEENKDERSGDTIKLFLKEALKWKWNKMMDIISYILWKMPMGNASSSSNHFRGTAHFKVQVTLKFLYFKDR